MMTSSAMHNIIRILITALLLGKNGPAKKTVRIATFPSYIVLQLRRYYVDEGSWEPKKRDVEVWVDGFFFWLVCSHPPCVGVCVLFVLFIIFFHFFFSISPFFLRYMLT